MGHCLAGKIDGLNNCYSKEAILLFSSLACA